MKELLFSFLISYYTKSPICVKIITGIKDLEHLELINLYDLVSKKFQNIAILLKDNR